MSEISVEYVDHMGQDLTVANVARVSFGKRKEQLDGRDIKLIDYLAAHKHSSPFRHPQLQFRCEAPVFLARQLQKHSVGLTWNEISRRYVDTDIKFFVPDSWRSRPTDGIKQGSGEPISEAKNYYLSLVYEQWLEDCLSLYERMIGDFNVAPEMARMVLPQSMMVSWIWTGSLQAFHHVYQLRSGEGAQEEAKMFANKLQDVVKPLFPHSWQALNDAQAH